MNATCALRIFVGVTMLLAVGCAKAVAGGTDPAVLQAALKAQVKTTIQPIPLASPQSAEPQSDWDYFWNGPRGGGGSSGGYKFDTTSNHDAFMQRQKETDQRNFDARMRGAQNWGGPR